MFTPWESHRNLIVSIIRGKREAKVSNTGRVFRENARGRISIAWAHHQRAAPAEECIPRVYEGWELFREIVEAHIAGSSSSSNGKASYCLWGARASALMAHSGCDRANELKSKRTDATVRLIFGDRRGIRAIFRRRHAFKALNYSLLMALERCSAAIHTFVCMKITDTCVIINRYLRRSLFFLSSL